jgi:hypothetical protein
VQIALDLDPGIPVIECDARHRDSVRIVLMTLVRHVMAVTSPGSDYSLPAS